MRTSICIAVLLTVCGVQSRAGEFTVSEEFVKYVQTATNPQEFGLRDGRFHPYSTPLGRRIGYRQPVPDKRHYAEGWPQAEAQKRLREDLERTSTDLRQWLAKNHPAQPLDRLAPESQEMLLDFAYSEGLENLKPELVTAILQRDWKTLVDKHLYVRMQDASPDVLRNKAFADRWIYSKKLGDL